MVITTNPCTFSEYRIYPGRGIKFVSRDCKIHFFINKKCTMLFRRKIKAVKLNWTQAWRRYFQKSKAEQAVKKRTKRKVKVQKAIEGLSLEIIQKMKTPEEKLKIKAKGTQEVKERQRKLQDSKKKDAEKTKAGDKGKKAAQKAPVPKQVKAAKKI